MQRAVWAFAFTGLIIAGTFPATPPATVGAATDADAITVAPADWPWWRGPNRNGVADANQKPPVKWSATDNVLWQTPVPGRGHGSPTVVGDQVFIAAAEPDREMQSVLCYDRHTGKQLWQTEVHRGGYEGRATPKAPSRRPRRLRRRRASSSTSSTPARSAPPPSTASGKQLWQTKVTDYVLHQGYGSSPAVYQSLVLVSADNKGGGVIAGLDRATGNIVWKRDRPKLPNYASPDRPHDRLAGTSSC